MNGTRITTNVKRYWWENYNKLSGESTPKREVSNVIVYYVLVEKTEFQ